jgi:hypothetical protein
VPEESKETGEQSQTDTEVQTTTTISEDDKYKKVTIIVRIPKNGMVETFSDGDTAKQILTSLTTGGGRRKNKRNLTKKRHRKNT